MKNNGLAYILTVVTTLGILIVLLTLLNTRFVWLAIQNSISAFERRGKLEQNNNPL